MRMNLTSSTEWTLALENETVFANNLEVDDFFNVTSSFDVTNVASRHNCTGADESAFRTFKQLSWWFTGIVQVR